MYRNRIPFPSVALALALTTAAVTAQARYPGQVYAECNGPRRDGCRVATEQPIPADVLEQIRAKVRGNIVVPPGVQGSPKASYIVSTVDGMVVNVRLVQSTGNPALDAAIERAIRRSSPLPLSDEKSFDIDLP